MGLELLKLVDAYHLGLFVRRASPGRRVNEILPGDFGLRSQGGLVSRDNNGFG